MAYTDVVLADSPWLYWKLDDSGATAADGSGNGRTGTYTGSPAQSQSPLITVGSSVSFDATDDFCLSTAAIFNSSTATVEVWFDYDGTPPGGGQVFFIAGCNEGEASGTGDKQILINESGFALWYVFDGASNVLVGTVPLSTGRHHLVGVIDDAANTSYLYVDGALDNSVAAASSFAGYTNPNAMIGGLPTAIAGTTRKAGRRDEFALYTTALSADRILTHYQAGLGINEPIQVLAMQHHVFGHNVW